MPSIHTIYVAVAILWPTLSLPAAEVLLHTGSQVLTPASSPITPLSSQPAPKFIKFQREFFIDQDLLAALPSRISELENLPISAVEAIDLTKKDIDPNNALRAFLVTEVKLLKGPENGNPQVEFYLVSTVASGSEYHRIVLMNGQIIASKLRQIKE